MLGLALNCDRTVPQEANHGPRDSTKHGAEPARLVWEETTINAYQRTAALGAAIELDLFTAVDAEAATGATPC